MTGEASRGLTETVGASSDAVRVLIVEDSKEDSALLEALLANEGPRFRIDAVGTLKEALAHLSKNRCDVVILDLTLPDAFGLESLQRLQDGHSTLPILVLTAQEDMSTADLAIRQGAQDYLLKGRQDASLIARAIRYSIERKRAENALRDSEQRFEIMARATNDAVWDWNLSTNRMWWNVGVRSFLGYPPNSVGGDLAWWKDHIHPEDRDRIVDCLRAVIDGGGRFWLDEYRFLCADGSYANVFDRGHVILDERGKPVRMIGAMMDITDRKRAEEALRETNETLRTLVQASPLAISVVDTVGKVRIWNPAAERVFGWKAHEIVGHPIPAFFEKSLRRVLQGESITSLEIDARRKDESPVTLSLSMAPLRDAMGGISGAMGILSDVTEQKLAEVQRSQLEEQLRQSQKMEAVGRLAGGVAHDFNNLLTAISGYSEMIQARCPEAKDPIRGHAEEILKAASKAAQLTRQLLAYSRRQVLQPRTLSLDAVVRNLEGLLQRLIGEDIELSVTVQPGLGAVKADQGQIEQVILNLCVNARDAMPEGGRLTIETRNVDLDSSYHERHGRPRSGPHVVLAVSDTGVGMDEATLSHLFEPFFTTKSVDKGTGLGLATVYGIVKQSGGDIWAYSEPGRGSTFKIYLPRVDEVPETGPKPVEESRPGRGTETVLLVEDSDVVRRLLREILVRNGYHLLEARHGMEALERSRAHTGVIDILVTDMVMPEMNGSDLALQITKERPSVKVVFMSGYTEEAIVRHGMIRQGSAFLEKPFSPETLVKKIREILDAPGGTP